MAQHPWPDATLEPFLGGLTEAEFKSRFALDHEELIQGGKAILQGGGELGAVLFQAGGGLKNLLEVQRELTASSMSCSSPAGRSRDQRRACRAEGSQRSRSGRHLHSSEWIEHDRARASRPRGWPRSSTGWRTASRETPAGAAGGRLAAPVTAARSEQELAQLGDVALCPRRSRRSSGGIGTRHSPRREGSAARPSPSSIVRSPSWSSPRTCLPKPMPSNVCGRGWRGSQGPQGPSRRGGNLRQALAGASDLLAEPWPRPAARSMEAEEEPRSSRFWTHAFGRDRQPVESNFG